MKPLFKLPTQDQTHVGTSFHNTKIRCTAEAMKSVLGEPTYDSNDGSNKVNLKWVRVMEIDGKDVLFTVYDYKYYRPLRMNERVDWHIGGKNERDTEAAAKAILMAFEQLGKPRLKP